MNIQGRYTKAFMTTDLIDQGTYTQVLEMCNHPAATNPIAVMPDCHVGKGCVIGFTMPMGDKVVPNWIGVDIGCGMLAKKFKFLKEPDHKTLAIFDKLLRKYVPMGQNIHKSVDRDILKLMMAEFEKNHISDHQLNDLLSKTGMDLARFHNSIGTLGGGNHFIEMGHSSTDGHWITVHSGSRNFGLKVCEHFSDNGHTRLKNVNSLGLASYIESLKKQNIDKTKIQELRDQYIQEHKVDFDIKASPYVEGKELENYKQGMNTAQIYARFNRELIFVGIKKALVESGLITGMIKDHLQDEIETTHNYISMEDGIIRKGAIASYIGRRMIIPFNMRDGLLICEGKSNPEWNFSAPHGAGRLLSRAQAKQHIDIGEFERSMEGIFTTSVDKSTIDESPMAYKDPEIIKVAIQPTATILETVKPIYNVKAGGD